jgi:hypothetical protein
MTDEDFRQQLQHRIASYRSMRDRLESEVREVEEELADVRGRLETAERMYQMEFGESVASDVVVEMLPVRERIEGPLTGLSWREAIVRVLSDERRPMHVRELWERLQAGGFETGSQDPLRSIVAIAVRNDDLVKVRPNTYTLRQAGPGDGEARPLD